MSRYKILIFFLFALLVLSSGFSYCNQGAFTQRFSIPVNNTNPTTRTIQTEVYVPYRTGMDSALNYIGFCDENNTSLNRHKLEYESNSFAIYQVNMTLTGNSNTYIWVEFNNVTPISLPEKTISELCTAGGDNIEGGSINTTKWNASTGAGCTYVSSSPDDYMVCAGSDTTNLIRAETTPIGTNVSVFFKGRISSGGTTPRGIFLTSAGGILPGQYFVGANTPPLEIYLRTWSTEGQANYVNGTTYFDKIIYGKTLRDAGSSMGRMWISSNVSSSQYTSWVLNDTTRYFTGNIFPELYAYGSGTNARLYYFCAAPVYYPLPHFGEAGATENISFSNALSVSFGNSPADGSYDNDGYVRFDLKATDDSGLSYLGIYMNDSSCGGGSWGACVYNTTPYNNTFWNFTTLFPLSEGTYKWAGWANDTSSKTNFTSTNRTFTVDITAPSSSITSHTNNSYTLDTAPTISGTATDATSGVVRVWVSSDNGATWIPASGTTSWSYTFSTLPDGLYKFRSKAEDVAGNNQTTPANLYLTIDHTSPSNLQYISPTPIDNYYAKTPSYLQVNVSFTEANPWSCLLWNDTGGDFLFNLNQNQSAGGKNYCFFNLTGPYLNAYINYLVQIVDYSGLSTNTSIRFWSTDNTAPTITLKSPVTSYVLNSSSSSFAIATSYNAGGCASLWGNFSGSWAIDQTNCSGVSKTWPGSHTNYTFIKTVQEGYYKWSASSNDSLENANTSFLENRTLYVDFSSPNNVQWNSPSNATRYAGIPSSIIFNYSFNDTHPSTSSILWRKALNESSFSQHALLICANKVCDIELAGAYNSQRFIYIAQVFDTVGKSTNSSELYLYFDYINVTSPIDGSYYNTQNVTLNISSTSNGTNLTYSVDGGTNQTITESPEENTWYQSIITFSSNVLHSITVFFTYAWGTIASTLSLDVDYTAPEIGTFASAKGVNSYKNVQVNVQDHYNITCTLEENEATNYSMTVTPGICGGCMPGDPSPYTCTYNRTGMTANTNYSFKVYAIDYGGLVATKDSWYAYDANAPVVTIYSPVNGSNSSYLNTEFKFKVTDELATNYSCYADINGTGLLSQSVSNDTNISVFVNTTAGSYYALSVNCTDSGLASSYKYDRVFFTSTNAPPSTPTNFSPVSTHNPREQFVWNVTDLEGGTITSHIFINASATFKLTSFTDATEYIYDFADTNTTEFNVTVVLPDSSFQFFPSTFSIEGQQDNGSYYPMNVTAYVYSANFPTIGVNVFDDRKVVTSVSNLTRNTTYGGQVMVDVYTNYPSYVYLTAPSYVRDNLLPSNFQTGAQTYWRKTRDYLSFNLPALTERPHVVLGANLSGFFNTSSGVNFASESSVILSLRNSTKYDYTFVNNYAYVEGAVAENEWYRQPCATESTCGEILQSQIVYPSDTVKTLTFNTGNVVTKAYSTSGIASFLFSSTQGTNPYSITLSSPKLGVAYETGNILNTTKTVFANTGNFTNGTNIIQIKVADAKGKIRLSDFVSHYMDASSVGYFESTNNSMVLPSNISFGNYTFKMYATDSMNSTSSNATFDVQVYNTAPLSPSDIYPNGTYYYRPTNISWTNGPDSDGDIVYTNIILANGTLITEAVSPLPITYPQNYGILYAYRIASCDQYGECSDYESVSYNQSKTAPNVSSEPSLTLLSNVNNSFSFSSISGSEPVSYWIIDWGDGVNSTLAGGESLTAYHVHTPGNYTITAYACEDYQYVLCNSNTTELYAYNVAPEGIELISPIDGTDFHASTFTLEWNDLGDNNTFDVHTYDLELSDVPTFSTTFESVMEINTTSYTSSRVFPYNTPIYWRVRACDEEGLCSLYSDSYFLVTNTLPTFLSASISPAIPVEEEETTLSVSATDSDSDEIYYRFSTDNGATWTTWTTDNEFSITYPLYSRGTKNITISIKDYQGIATTDYYEFTVSEYSPIWQRVSVSTIDSFTGFVTKLNPLQNAILFVGVGMVMVVGIAFVFVGKLMGGTSL